uniref:Uncharacterized protein n=1 Tax=Ditylenchus dipsaci TaxID=166011 RepID=A0A915DI47_9BILA
MSAVSFGTSSTASPNPLTAFNSSAQDIQPSSTAPRRKQAKPQRIDEDKKKSSTADLLHTTSKSKANTAKGRLIGSPSRGWLDAANSAPQPPCPSSFCKCRWWRLEYFPR